MSPVPAFPSAADAMAKVLAGLRFLATTDARPGSRCQDSARARQALMRRRGEPAGALSLKLASHPGQPRRALAPNSIARCRDLAGASRQRQEEPG